MTILDRADALIQRDVLEEFVWDPEVEVSEVGVSVVDGIVTLTGTVDTYASKMAAQHATLRIHGVRAVANDLVVQDGFGPRLDAEIARDAAASIEARRLVPPGEIRIAVDAGRIILEGKVPWEFQRAAAERFVTDIKGVREIENQISIQPLPVSDADTKVQVERALARNAGIHAAQVQVDVEGDIVRLTGKVGSWSERNAAAGAAWRAKGVARVLNEIVVAPALAERR